MNSELPTENKGATQREPLTLADLTGASFTGGGRELPSDTNIDFTNSAGATVTVAGFKG